MTTGWPQNQQDLRWSYSDSDETGPGSQPGRRVATDSDRPSSAGGFGEHPSGPLPVTPAPQQRGRFGRGRSRDAATVENGSGDADYDWIRYLGEAGPAQEHSRRPSGDGPAKTDDRRERGSRPAGRRFSRRPVADDGPSTDTQGAVFPAESSSERPASEGPPFERAPFERPAFYQAAADSTTVLPQPPQRRAERPGEQMPRPPEAGGWPDAPSRSRYPTPADAQPGLVSGAQPRTSPAAWPADPRSTGAWPADARSGAAWPEPSPSATSPWPAQDRPVTRRPVPPASAQPADSWLTQPDQRQAPGAHGFEQDVRSRPDQRSDTGQHALVPGPGQASLAAIAAAGRAAADTVTDLELGVVSPAKRVGRRGPSEAGQAAQDGRDGADAQRDRGARRLGGRKSKKKQAPAKAAAPPKAAASAAAGTGLESPAAASAAGTSESRTRADAQGAAITATNFIPAPAAAPPARLPGVRPAAARTSAEASPVALASPAAAPAKQPTSGQPPAARRSATRRKARHPVRVAVIAGSVVVAAGGAAFAVHAEMGGSTGPQHSISTPSRLQAYVQNSGLASGLGAQALRADILRRGNGEASHVVDAVYEDSTGPGTKTGPLIILFVGGNLSGSAGSFISSFTGMLPSAFVTSPGRMGGQAACVPGTGGHPAECAWADNDTFGLIASPTLSASALGQELRSMRPLVEHTRR